MASSYFSHDSNARNSKKIIRLRQKHGAAGYGVYFMLLERLRDESGYISDTDYEMLSFDLRVEPELIRSVVEDFGLFEIEDNKFRSAGFVERMEMKDSRSQAGKKGAESRWGTPSRIAQDGKSIANNMANDGSHDFANSNASDKERKEKESKENTLSLSLPSAVADGRAERGEREILYKFFFSNWATPNLEMEKFFNHYNSEDVPWAKMTKKQRTQAIAAWHQIPPQPPRFNDQALDFWAELYTKILELCAPSDVIFAALSDKISIAYSSETLRITCPACVSEFIERNLDDTKPILKAFMDMHHLKRLTYVST